MSWLTALLAGYTTIQGNGVVLPQQRALNFGGNFTVANDPANGRTNISVVIPAAVVPASSGLASSRPAATGSGKMYFATDVGVVYLDDPLAEVWLQFLSGYVPAGPAASAFTNAGSISTSQYGDVVRATYLQQATGQFAASLLASGSLGRLRLGRSISLPIPTLD